MELETEREDTKASPLGGGNEKGKSQGQVRTSESSRAASVDVLEPMTRASIDCLVAFARQH